MDVYNSHEEKELRECMRKLLSALAQIDISNLLNTEVKYE